MESDDSNKDKTEVISECNDFTKLNGNDLNEGQVEAGIPSYVSPDGGWGWAVTLAAFMLILLVDGVCFTFGLFYPEFLDYFEDSKSKTAVVGSVINGAQMGLGPISAALVNKLGCRKVAMLGSFVSSVGFFLCTFSPNVDIMIVLYGAVGGCGFGMMYLSSIVMVGQYFEKKRAVATGIAVCGSGIGNFVFAPLCEFLLDSFAWKGAMWIISGIVLNGVVFATLFRPLTEFKKTYQFTDSKKKLNETTVLESAKQNLYDGTKINGVLYNSDPVFDNSYQVYKCRSMELHLYKKDNENALNGGQDCAERLTQSQDFADLKIKLKNRNEAQRRKEILSPLARKDIFYSGSLHRIPENQKFFTENDNKATTLDKRSGRKSSKSGIVARAKRAFFQTFDFSLLLSPTFAIYGGSCFLCMLGFFIPFNFLPDLAMSMNISLSDAAFLISIIGIANTVARILVGLISDQPWADSLVINNVALICGGVSTFFVPYYKQYGIMAAYSAVFGASIAAFVSLRSIIMVELMGIEKLTNAFGLVVLCQGMSSFIGPPIAGALSDITGNYDASFYMAGATIGLAGVICLPLRKVASLDKKIKQINAHRNKDLHFIVDEEGKTMLEQR